MRTTHTIIQPLTHLYTLFFLFLVSLSLSLSLSLSDSLLLSIVLQHSSGASLSRPLTSTEHASSLVCRLCAERGREGEYVCVIVFMCACVCVRARECACVMNVENLGMG